MGNGRLYLVRGWNGGRGTGAWALVVFSFFYEEKITQRTGDMYADERGYFIFVGFGEGVHKQRFAMCVCSVFIYFFCLVSS